MGRADSLRRGEPGRRGRVTTREDDMPGKRVTIYGIKNCDTMKKARAWLDARGVAYQFHGYKAAGIEGAKLQGWAREVGWGALLKRAGTTFRARPVKDKDGLTVTESVAVMP